MKQNNISVRPITVFLSRRLFVDIQKTVLRTMYRIGNRDWFMAGVDVMTRIDSQRVDPDRNNIDNSLLLR